MQIPEPPAATARLTELEFSICGGPGVCVCDRTSGIQVLYSVGTTALRPLIGLPSNPIMRASLP